ncbi:MAG: sigma-70 family RNA polymerase sigma factor [Ignavibacteriae bacterium]|nr:sigma-70 family RNA polymerase sigma factor [Ignavibacteriota bacterium]
MDHTRAIDRLPEGVLERLVRGIRSGDRASFRDFFFLFQPDVFRFIFRLTRDRQVAEDLTQDTFLRFWDARDRLDATGSPASYLFRIARNLVLDEADRRKPSLEITGAPEEVLVRYSRDPEEEYARRLAADEVLNALTYLPERSRVAFVLSRYHDMNNDEIAVTMQISVQTVKNQISRALTLLRKRLVDGDGG